MSQPTELLPSENIDWGGGSLTWAGICGRDSSVYDLLSWLAFKSDSLRAFAKCPSLALEDSNTKKLGGREEMRVKRH